MATYSNREPSELRSSRYQRLPQAQAIATVTTANWKKVDGSGNAALAKAACTLSAARESSFFESSFASGIVCSDR